MVKVDEILKRATSYLKVGVVKDGEVVEIVDEGEIVPAEKSRFGRDVFRIKVRLPNGEEKLWTMNYSTIRRLAKAYGTDTAKWVGKKVIVRYREVELEDRTVVTLDGYPAEKAEGEEAELVKLVEALKKSGIRALPVDEFKNVARLRGIRTDPIKLARKIGLKITQNSVELQ